MMIMMIYEEHKVELSLGTWGMSAFCLFSRLEVSLVNDNDSANKRAFILSYVYGHNM